MEGYKTVKYNGIDFEDYLVNEECEVYSIKTKKILKHSNTNSNYVCVSLYKDKKLKSSYIHRIMYETFVGTIPKDYEIDHIDQDRENNRLENLRLMDKRSNRFNKKDNNPLRYIRLDNKGKYLFKIKIEDKNYTYRKEELKIVYDYRNQFLRHYPELYEYIKYEVDYDEGKMDSIDTEYKNKNTNKEFDPHLGSITCSHFNNGRIKKILPKTQEKYGIKFRVVEGIIMAYIPDKKEIERDLLRQDEIIDF